MKVVLEIESNNANSLNAARGIINHLEIEVLKSKSKDESNFDRWIEQFLNPKHEVPKFNKPVEWSKIIDSFKDRFPVLRYPKEQLQNQLFVWAADQGYKIDISSKDEITIQQ